MEKQEQRESTGNSNLVTCVEIDISDERNTSHIQRPTGWPRTIDFVYRDAQAAKLDSQLEDARYSLGFLKAEDEVTIQPFVTLAFKIGRVVGIRRSDIPRGWGQYVGSRIGKGLRSEQYKGIEIIFPTKLVDKS